MQGLDGFVCHYDGNYLIMGIAQSTCLPHGRSNGTACPEVLCNVEALAMTIGYLSNYLLRCMCGHVQVGGYR